MLGLDYMRYLSRTVLDEIEAAIDPATKMIWIESPTNPMLRMIDIAACAEIAHRKGLMLAVDNTFASPYLQNPLALGAHVSRTPPRSTSADTPIC